MASTPTFDTNGAVMLALVRRCARDGTARRLRESAHLSQREVARSLGVHVSTVCRWESGECPPRGTVAAQYGALLAELDALGLDSTTSDARAGYPGDANTTRQVVEDACPA